MEKKMNVSNVKIAEVRYFDTTKNATEIPKTCGYVFLLDIDGKYVNVFNPLQKINVYDRLPYSNTTIDGEDYGNKLFLSSGEVSDGVCYVIEPFSMEKMIGKNMITYEELENIVIKSKLFFIDRKSILEKKRNSFIYRIKYRKVIESDKENMDKLESYLNEYDAFQYKK